MAFSTNCVMETFKVIILVSLVWIIINFSVLCTWYMNDIKFSGSSLTGESLSPPILVETQIELAITDDESKRKSGADSDDMSSNRLLRYPIEQLELWHPAASTADSSRVGPGEGGRPLSLNDSLLAESERRFKENEFDVVVSELICVNRTLPIVRPQKCSIKRYPALLPATTVVIVFHNEAWSTLERTLCSIVNRSPWSLVREILLVDDGSHLDFLGKKLDDYVATLPIDTKILRKKNRTGIISSRLLGAEHANSQVLTFLNSHCECTDGWLEPLLARIVIKRNAVVSPIPDIISGTTFEYRPLQKNLWGGFDWDLNYKWVQIPQREYDRNNYDESKWLRTPVIPGDLYSIDKNYFYELGSYDEDMHFWGGENLDLSFRVWMYGGTLEFIPCSRVAHVSRAKSPTNVPRGVEVTVGRNLVRVAKVWMDQWKFIHYMYNQHAFDVDVGNVSKRLNLKNKLKFKSFRWYLKKIYPEFPKYHGDYYVGQIKNVETQQCLDTKSRKIGQNVDVNNCYQGRNDSTQNFGITPSSLILTENINCFGTSSNNESISLFKCHKNDVKLMWNYDNKSQTIVHNITHKCLEHSITFNASFLALNKCSGTRNQQWIFDFLII